MTKLRWHPSLTPERWAGFTRERQILLIGSEFARAKSLLRSGGANEAKLCIARGLELLDLLSSDLRQWGGRRLREVRRFRELVAAWYIDDAASPDALDLLYRTLMEWDGNTARVKR